MGCGASQSSRVEIFSDPKFVDITRAWDMAWRTVEVKKIGNMEHKLVIKRRGWKSIRIFVSSTFRDFHQEREVLVKKVFPDLRAWCEARRLYLIDVDLRWGVPKDFTSESTLRACLGEIDRCYHENIMPFFLNMTSDRIGWIPLDHEVPEIIKSTYKWIDGLSVTEMEIMHGAYRKDNPNALFLLRDPSFLDEVPIEQRKEFIDNNEIAPYKLQVLKKMITDRFPANRVVHYKVKYEGYNSTKNIVELGGLEGTFSQAVFEFFKKRITMQYPLQEGDSNPLHHIKDAHESFMKSRCDTVIGRDDILKQIENYICGNGTDVPLLVVAGAGCGKSSVMAKVADMACNKALSNSLPRVGKNNWLVFYHFIGAVPGSTELLLLLRRLLYEMKAVPEDQLPSNVDTAAQVACGVLNNPNSLPIIIVINALNQLDEDTPALLMNWIPRKLAPQIRCVFTMIDGTPQHTALLQREPRPHILELAPLNLENRKAIVHELLGRYNKKLDKEQMDGLLGKESSENPLWLSIACEELRVFGRFREISDKINQLADGLLELESQILARFEEENGGQLLIATLCLLEVSSRGLLEIELLSILGDEEHIMPREAEKEEEKESAGEKDKDCENTEKVGPLPAYKWTEIYRALRPFLRPFGDSGEGRLDFYHRSLSKAIRRKYFILPNGDSNDHIICWWHTKLANYFEKCANLNRQIEEYPHHLIAINARDKLEKFLTNWDVFDQLFNEDFSYNLLTFWRKGSTFDRCESCYVTAITNLDNSGSVGPEELCQRYLKVANFMHQCGRYKKALQFAEKAREIEETGLGCRPEKMADIYQMCGLIMDEEMKMIEYMYASQIPQILNIVEQFLKAIEIRRTISGDTNQLKLGKALNRLSFYYSGVAARGGCESLTKTEAKEKSIVTIDEAIQIFTDIKDETKVADSIITKGVAYGTACPEQLKAYKDAEEILFRVTGRLHTSVDRLYLNMGICYEELGEPNLAFECFYKWFEVCQDLYGLTHTKTKRPISTLNESQYRRIAAERGIEIPQMPVDENQGT